MMWRRRYEVVVVGETGSATSQRSVISEHRNERDAREAAAQERRRLEVIRAEEAASWVVLVTRADEILHEERPFDGRRGALPPSPLDALVAPRREPVADAPAAGPPDTRMEHRDEDPAGTGETAAPAGGEPGEDRTPSSDAAAATSDTGTPADSDSDSDSGERDAEAAPAPEPEPEPGETGRALRPTPRGPAPAARPGGEDWDIAPFTVERPAPADDAPAGTDAPAVDRPATATGGRRDEDIPSGRVPDDVIRRFEESIARERARDRDRGGPAPKR